MITIIVPVYNVEKYLHDCIESILNQTYKDFELILVDDGSKDNSGKICDEFAQKDYRINTIHQKNAGEGMARNAGLEIANGEWMVFVDSDDYIRPDYIKDLLKAQNDSNADIVISGMDRVYGDGSIETLQVPMKDISVRGNLYDIIRKYHLIDNGYISGKLYKSSIINDRELRFSSLKLKADQLFLFSYLAHVKRITFRPLHDYCYRQLGDSMSHLSFDYNMLLSRVMDFYKVVKKTDFGDSRINHYLTQNSLDGPIGKLYSQGELSREERIQHLKLVDKSAYWYTRQIKSYKDFIITVLLSCRAYKMYDKIMCHIFNKSQN